MSNERQLIRTLVDPTIVLDDLQMMDTENGSATSIGSPTSPVSMAKQIGGVSPLVQINNRAFESEQIVSMEIRCEGDRPSATVSFSVRDKSFYSTSFPKDGDLMSIFVRSKDDLFKPIRNDYEITSVNVYPRPGGGENTPEDMTISGLLRVPGLDAEKCFSDHGTSMDIIMNASTALKLGFATNEVSTADEQTWICPFEKTSDFLYNVTLSAWKDEQSFFTYFLDHYYCVNFVNVDPLFSEKPEIDDALALNLLTNDYGKDSVQAKFKGKNVLTNWDDASSTNFYIQSYSLVNNSATVNMREGYRRFSRYYDAFIKESQNLYVDPLTTPGSERDQIIMKGRPGEDFYLEQIRSKWMGVQYGKDGENSHPKINYAKINNYQNMVHLQKMYLQVSLESVNFNLRRFQVIPVVIVIKKDYSRKRINEPVDESQQLSSPNPDEPNREKTALSFEETPITLDKTVCGYYVIRDIIYKYNKGKFTQDCVLFRREWPTPPQLY